MSIPETELRDGKEYLKGTETRVWRGFGSGHPDNPPKSQGHELDGQKENDNDTIDAEFRVVDPEPTEDQGIAPADSDRDPSIDLKTEHTVRQNYQRVEHEPVSTSTWQDREALGQPVLTKVGGKEALPNPDFMDFEAFEQQARQQAQIKVERERRERENRESFQTDTALLATRCALMLTDELSTSDLEGSLLIDQQAEDQKKQASKESRLSRLFHKRQETPKPTEYMATYEVDVPVGEGARKHYSVVISGHREDGQSGFTLKGATCQERYIRQYTDSEGEKRERPVGGFDLVMTPQLNSGDVITGMQIHIEPSSFQSYESPWARTIASDAIDGFRSEYPEKIRVTQGFDIQLDTTDLENPTTFLMQGVDGTPIRSSYDADNNRFTTEHNDANDGQWQGSQKPLARNFGRRNMTNLARETLDHFIPNPQHARPGFWPIPETEFSWNQEDDLG